MKIAIVGATGLVGRKILRVLEERNFPISELYLAASEKSVGREIRFKTKTYKLMCIEEVILKKPQIAIFSAGSRASLQWAPKFVANGTKVIDNSSAWRMDESKKLIVPEINATALSSDDYIVANPNCSTIQMVLPLAPLHKKYQIKRLVISTYQAVTGTGEKAIQQLKNERLGRSNEKAYLHEIDLNCLPHCDEFTENGYTKEEMKLIHETRKILQDNCIRITATAVRVPVVGGHSESVNVEFYKEFDIKEVRQILLETRGVLVHDDVANNKYPMPKYAEDRDEVFVGRIRRDHSQTHALNLWIVADNLRKGAALNAVQIAEYMLQKKLV